MALSQKASKFLEDSLSRGRPVPGQSLTNSPSQPYKWERPPEFTKSKEAMLEVFTTLTEPETTANILLSLNNGVGVIDLASVTLYTGFLEGKWNPDLMMLLMEPTMFMIMALAEKAEIDFVLEAGDDEQDVVMSGDKQVKKLESAVGSLDAIRKKAVNNVSEQAVPKEIRQQIDEVEISPSLLEKVQNEKPQRESLLSKGEENNE